MARVKVEVSAETAAFHSAMKGVEKQFEDLKKMAIGFFSIEAVKSLTENTFEFADSLVNSAQKLDLTIEQVQVLKKVAQDSGTEFDQLAVAIGKVAILREKALKGDTDSILKLNNVGVERNKIGSMSAEDILFKAIGDKVKNGSLDKIALPVSEVLGKGFESILPALKENVDDTAASLKKMGLIMDGQTAVALKTLKDEFNDLGTFLDITFGEALINIVNFLMDTIGKQGSYLNTVFAGLKGWAEWFKGQTNNKVPDYTAPNGKVYSGEQRFNSADMLMQAINDAINKQHKDNPKADDKTDLAEAYKDVVAQMKDPQNYDLYGQTLADYNGNNMGDLMKYLQGVTKPYKDAQDNIYKGVDDSDVLSKSISDTIKAYQDKIAARTKQIGSNGTGAGDNTPIINEQKRRSIYSDNLTSVGNMLGASYQGISHVTNQMDLQKQANNKFDKMLEKMELSNTYLGVLSKNKPTAANMGFDTSLF